jgi:hypothetical protein
MSNDSIDIYRDDITMFRIYKTTDGIPGISGIEVFLNNGSSRRVGYNTSSYEDIATPPGHHVNGMFGWYERWIIGVGIYYYRNEDAS